jgi:hypothetical protein
MEKPRKLKKPELVNRLAVLIASGKIDSDRQKGWHKFFGPHLHDTKFVEAVSIARSARERTGNAHVLISLGETAVSHITNEETGAELTALARPKKSDPDILKLDATLVDNEGPIYGMAVLIKSEKNEDPGFYVTTNEEGKFKASILGPTAILTLGNSLINQ